MLFFLFKQKTAYEMRISDWSSDVCSSDLAVEARPVLARKALEPVESAIFVEGGEIGFERDGRVEDSRAAAGIFLRIDRMRRAVGAEEKFGRARGGRGAHREPVPLALGDRQAIGVRAAAAHQPRIAIDVQMLRGDRRGEIGRAHV